MRIFPSDTPNGAQQKVIYPADPTQSNCVAGAAGTGKTFTAAHRVRDVLSASSGDRVPIVLIAADNHMTLHYLYLYLEKLLGDNPDLADIQVESFITNTF